MTGRRGRGGGKGGGTHNLPSKLLGSGKAKQTLLPLDLCHPSPTFPLRVTLSPPSLLSCPPSKDLKWLMTGKGALSFFRTPTVNPKHCNKKCYSNRKVQITGIFYN
ncbi:hypothetical protein CDAR_615591 [Caerostris darwini]|uniref:Uncharacterized protein n=1 Tax=Caerostris darwini TaxID=1538125 RepID=A0AAV4RV11_9ARAC|nr:hypothetical protein CDAR_615591 [Caerostris darwini]